jgi:hypothetical protein
MRSIIALLEGPDCFGDEVIQIDVDFNRLEQLLTVMERENLPAVIVDRDSWAWDWVSEMPEGAVVTDRLTELYEDEPPLRDLGNDDATRIECVELILSKHRTVKLEALHKHSDDKLETFEIYLQEFPNG